MDKHFLDRQTRDGAQLTIEQIAAICPSAVTEVRDENTGEPVRKINFTTLRQLLGDLAEDAPHEVYDFTWVGKNAARREAAMPISDTLLPCPEESVDWDNTKNLYIEGDNLKVLKLLQNYYANQIKMIYIDPPYNTGKDFVYHDDFSVSVQEYEEESGARDEFGNRFFVNTESSSDGRFHSDWCSMILPRLYLARTLLANDGVIFISIDDNEVDNLKKIANEVFGEDNYLATLNIQVRYGDKSLNEEKDFKPMIEYVLVYAKNSKVFIPNRPTEEYGLNGFVFEINEITSGEKLNINGQEVILFKKGEWSVKKHEEGSLDLLKETWISGSVYTNMSYGQVFQKVVEPRTDIDGLGCLYKVLGRGEDGLGYRYYTGPQKATASRGKMYSGVPLSRVEEINSGKGSVRYKPILCYRDLSADFGNIRHEGGIPFNSGKKPVKMLCDLINLQSDKNCIVLDFFSGSASTAHAVMQQNMEDGGNRKFIMVQIPEIIEENNELYKQGFRNICEIGEERIRRAGKQIKESAGIYAGNLDTGFRVLKLADSNFKQVSFPAKEYSQAMLAGMVDNIRDDRNDLDLLFDCMLRWGVELSLPIERSQADHCQILNVNDGDLVACLAPNETITEAVIDAIASMHPLRIVLRDTAFEEASQKMNIYELFKQRLGWSDDQASKQIRVI